MRKQVEICEKKDNARINRMNDRMSKLEVVMEKNIEQSKIIEILKKDQMKIREQLRKDQENIVRQFRQETGMKQQQEEKTHRKVKDEGTDKEENKENKEENRNTNKETIEEQMNNTSDSYTSDWVKSLNNQLKDDAVKTMKPREKSPEKDITDNKIDEKLQMKKKKGMTLIRKWFSDETSSDSETSDDSLEWMEIQISKINKEKKKIMRKMKEKREEQTLRKATHILGIGPIDYKLKNHQNKQHKDTKTATISEAINTIEAIIDFLGHHLGYNKEELDNIVQLANKDDIVYAAFQNINKIKEIRMRVAESGNTDILLRNFIPPQLFERFKFLNKICKDMRDSNEELKTQLRFSTTDIEILTKIRGSNKPYKKYRGMVRLPWWPSLSPSRSPLEGTLPEDGWKLGWAGM